MAPYLVCSVPFCTSDPQPLPPGPCCCWLCTHTAAGLGFFASLSFAIGEFFKEGKRRGNRKRRKGRALPSVMSSLQPQPSSAQQHVALTKITNDYAAQVPIIQSPRRTASLPITTFRVPHLKCDSKPLLQDYPRCFARQNPDAQLNLSVR